jgi:hypothetical protein
MPPKKTKRDRRGDEIRFIGGTHEGKIGWLNKSKKAKDGWVYVIVNQEKDEEEGTFFDYATRVQLFSIAAPLKDPRNDAEAFLQYHQDIDKLLTEISKKMAKCNVKASDTEFLKEFHALHMEKLIWAKDVQDKTGHKAAYRRSLPDR